MINITEVQTVSVPDLIPQIIKVRLRGTAPLIQHKFSQKGFAIIKNFIENIGATIEEGPKKEGSIIFALVNKK